LNVTVHALPLPTGGGATHREDMMDNDSEMSAQDTVTCGCGMVTLEKGRIVTKGYCYRCNTLLGWHRGKPRVTPMVPAMTSEAVRGTRLWECLQMSPSGDRVPVGTGERLLLHEGRLLGLLDVDQDSDGDNHYCHSSQGRVILTALQQGGLAAAEWLADLLRQWVGADHVDPICPADAEACQFECYGGPGMQGSCPGKSSEQAKKCWLAAALAATGQEQPSDDDLQIAIDELASHDIHAWGGHSGGVLPYFNKHSGYGPCWRCTVMLRDETWEQFVRRTLREMRANGYQPSSKEEVGRIVQTEWPSQEPTAEAMLDALEGHATVVESQPDEDGKYECWYQIAAPLDEDGQPWELREVLRNLAQEQAANGGADRG
jgi:hypothetical protein